MTSSQSTTSLRGSAEGEGAYLLALVTSDRTRGKGTRLHQGKLDIRKRFFTERVGGHSWSYGLVLGSPARSRELDLMVLMGPFQLEICYGSVTLFWLPSCGPACCTDW